VSDVVKCSVIVSAGLYSAISRSHTYAVRPSIKADDRICVVQRDLKVKGQGHWEQKCKKNRFFRASLSKMVHGSIYVKPWTVARTGDRQTAQRCRPIAQIRR